MSSDTEGRPIYAMYCRNPGRRIDQIMQMIDDGLSDEEISDRYGGEQYGADVATIHVYRLAHDNKLSHLAKFDTVNAGLPRALLKATVRQLHENGLTSRQIAGHLGIRQDTVSKILKGYRSAAQR